MECHELGQPGENWLKPGEEKDEEVAGGRCEINEDFHWFLKMGEAEPCANFDYSKSPTYKSSSCELPKMRTCVCMSSHVS